MNGQAIRELAQAIAVVVHDGVSRKGAGEPYINHCTRVAMSPRLWGWRQQALGWMHDVIEDAEEFGSTPSEMEAALRVLLPGDLVDDLMMLSRLPRPNISAAPVEEKQPYQEWIAVIAERGGFDVIRVKLADLEDNLKDIRDVPGMQSQESRYLRAKATLLDALEEKA